MRIKKVKVSGFKSYKSLSEMEFSEGMNVIVGPNGSGKSNWISAIHYALSDEYGKMKGQQRKTLLHNGEESRLPSFVEIEFDNSDRRLPVDEDQVFFRRVFGLKKDKLLVNGQEVSEIKTFLNHAGFINPYYIVKQGKITELSQGSDKDRLDLLKQVAGISMYDINYSKIMGLVSECNLISNIINERLDTIQKRLEELRKEQEELHEVSTLDVEKRSIEYVVFGRELEECKVKIGSTETRIEDRREQWSGSLTTKLQEYKENQNSLMEIGKELTERKYELGRYKLLKTRTDSDIIPIIEEEQRAKQKLEDYKQKLSFSETDVEAIDKEVTTLQQKLEEDQELLDKIGDKYERLKEREQAFKEGCIQKETQLSTLKEKLGKFSTFKSLTERNEAINKNINEVNEENQKLKELVNEENERIRNFQTQRDKLQEKFRTINDQGFQVKLSKLNNKIEEAQKNLYEKNSERDKNWDRLNKYSEKYQLECQNESEAKEKLSKVLGRNIILGIEGVLTIVDDFENVLSSEHEVVVGYKGIVLGNINCNEEVHTAVEVAGGGMLGHHIVTSHAVGQQILKIFNQQKMRGVVNFIIMERIIEPTEALRHFQDAPVTAPISRMIDHVQTLNPDVGPVLRFVFGKSLLCQSSETAGKVSKKYKMTCVTIDGDRNQKSGLLSGGYMNPTKSKFKLYQQWSLAKRDMAACLEIMDECCIKDGEIQTETNEIHKIIEKLKSKKIRIQDHVEESLRDKEIIRFNLDCIADSLKGAEKHLNDLHLRGKQLEAQGNNLKTELTQPLGKQNEDEDIRKVQELDKEVRDSRTKSDKVSKNKIRYENKGENLEKSIARAMCHIQQLQSKKSFFLQETTKNKLTTLEDDVKRLELAVTRKRDLQSTLLERIPIMEQECQQKREDELVLLAKQREIGEQIAKGHPDIPKLEENLQRLKETLSGCESNIKTISGIPSGVHKYMNLEKKVLMKRLKKVNNKLEKYKDVDRMVLNHYTQLNENHLEIMAKINELDSSREKVKQLRAILEASKEQRIVQYFGRFEKRLAQVFKSLVPQGRVKLALEGVGPDTAFSISGVSEDVEEMPKISEDQLTGMSLRVSFRGSINERAQKAGMAELSGGQRSLVSLALILAIQKLDPVPVYLFDEVDQALDRGHREAVARVIHEMSSEAQFICTTFRKEFVEQCQSAYGVGFAQSSRIKGVSKEQALRFIEDSSASCTSDSSFFDQSASGESVRTVRVRH